VPMFGLQLLLLDKSDADDNLVTALRSELQKARSGGGSSGPRSPPKTAAVDGEAKEAARRVSDLSRRISEQQMQIDRQEQIINALRTQLAGQEALSEENIKLRELVHLLQEKLAEG